MTTIEHLWDDVRAALDDALAITWDGCHKIYILMDAGQVEEFTSYGYEPLDVDDPDDAIDLLGRWYDQSCFLRFVSAISTHPDDPNLGYDQLIPQGAGEDDE